ncbi:E3 SUMO-protein ligase KIAA1586-like, partial [Aphis craccivora]
IILILFSTGSNVDIIPGTPQENEDYIITPFIESVVRRLDFDIPHLITPDLNVNIIPGTPQGNEDYVITPFIGPVAVRMLDFDIPHLINTTDNNQDDLQIEEINKQKNSRKRKKNIENWKKNKAALQRSQGKEYISQKGKIVPAKSVNKHQLCQLRCRLQCSTNIDIESRNNLFNEYYKMDVNVKNAYIFKSIKKLETGRKTVNSTPKKERSHTFQYFVKTEEKDVKVCKTAFCEIYQIGREKIELIQNQLKFNVSCLDRKEKCKEDNMSSSFLVKEDSYRNIFCTRFNLNFENPKNGTCSRCDSGQISDINHIQRYKNAFEVQRKDKEKVLLDSTICYLTMDLQQTMPLPKLSTSKAFYLRQLWFYNFGVHTLSAENGHQPFMFTWTENVGGKGNHKFPEVGHSYLDSDRDFGRIEKRLRKYQNIYTLEQYRNIIKEASKKNTVISEMEHHFKSIENIATKLRLTNKKKTVKYKDNFNEETPFITVNIFKDKTNTPKECTLTEHKKSTKISNEKIENLKSQSQFVPEEYKWFYEQSMAYKTILECYIKPEYLNNTDIEKIQYRNPTYYLKTENIYLGGKCMAYLSNSNDCKLSNNEKNDFINNCLNFYIECAHQLFKRFPFNSNNVKCLKALSFLNPQNVKNINSVVPAAQYFETSLGLNLNDIDREWRQLRNIELNFDLELLEFWKVVVHLNDGNGDVMFPFLSKLINFLIILPHSSACVERIFSCINLNKTKVRNRLSTESLIGLLHSKNILNSQQQSCYNFNVDKTMIKKHNSFMYSS